MKLSTMLKSIASQLESPYNEAITSDEAALACVKAANDLAELADKVSVFEKEKLLVAETKQLLEVLAATSFNKNKLNVTLYDGEDLLGVVNASPEEALLTLKKVELPADITSTVSLDDIVGGIDEAAKVASFLDGLGLTKQASVIDELLLTIATPPNALENMKAAQKKSIDDIKRLYEMPNEKLHEVIGVEDAKKAIEKSEYMKVRRPLQESLSTRYCPEHFGAPMQRVGEDEWACSLDHKKYDYKAGFKADNKVVPGGNVSEQTKFDQFSPHQMFDNRDSRLNKNK